MVHSLNIAVLYCIVLYCIVFCTTKWPIKSQNWNYAFYNPKKAFHYVSSTLSGHLVVQKEIMMYIFQIQCQKPTHKSWSYWTLIEEFLGIRGTCMAEACHIGCITRDADPRDDKRPLSLSQYTERSQSLQN